MNVFTKTKNKLKYFIYSKLWDRALAKMRKYQNADGKKFWKWYWLCTRYQAICRNIEF